MEAENFARLYAEKLGGSDKLLTTDMDHILAAQSSAKSAWPGNFPFRPMVDGHTLPMVPLDRIASAKAPPIPMLIGSNADESRLFLPTNQAAGPCARNPWPMKAWRAWPLSIRPMLLLFPH
jgi:para-nitrobenzyl esterase